MTPAWWRQRIRILDGATGTELQRRGVEVASPAWTNAGLIAAPALVREVHRDYVRAGAEIITANTFRLNKRCLREMGAAHRGQELRALAIGLAREAAGDGVLVAGSVAPVEDCYDPSRVPGYAVLVDDHADSIGGLVTAGVDVILAETMNTIREAVVCAELCRALAVPCIVGLACGPDGKLLGGESVAAAVAALDALVAGIVINCTSLAGTRRAFASVDRGALLGCYPNIEAREPAIASTHVNRYVASERSPAELAAFAIEMIERHGARLIGGCCGTKPAHIAQLRSQLR